MTELKKLLNELLKLQDSNSWDYHEKSKSLKQKILTIGEKAEKWDLLTEQKHNPTNVLIRLQKENQQLKQKNEKLKSVIEKIKEWCQKYSYPTKDGFREQEFNELKSILQKGE